MSRVCMVLLLALAGCSTPPAPAPAAPAPASRPTAPGRVDVVVLAERTGATSAIVRVEVAVEPGWRLYGLTSEYGVAPQLELGSPDGVTLDGPLQEPPAAPDLALGDLPITAHRGRVTFTQHLALATAEAVAIPAAFTWQVCDEDDTFCAPGRVDATLVLGDERGRADGWWPVGDDPRVVVRLLLMRQPSADRALLGLEATGLHDWTVEGRELEVLTSTPGVDVRVIDFNEVGAVRPADPNWLLVGPDDAFSRALTYPPAASGRPVAVTVRWRARTRAGTPGQGEVRASLPLPPP